MASFLYLSYLTKLLNGGGVDLDTDTIRMMLLDDTYVPDQDAHDFKNDLSGEIAGLGYTARGMALADKTITQDDTNNRTVWDATDVSWPASTLTARYAVLYKDTGVDSTSPLIALIDFGENKSTSISTFTVPFNTDGILRASIV